MFNKLRNHFVLINLGITTGILLIVFVAIYMISARTMFDRPMPQGPAEMEPGTSKIMDERIGADRRASLDSLLTTLIISGILVEVVVAIISYFLAEKAITPIKNTYEAQKTFIANASHEIKTPLAAIHANLEAANIKNNHWIDNIAYETDKLTSLNNQMLALARTDTMPTQPKLKTVCLKTELQQVIDVAQSQIDAKKLKLTFRASPQNPTKINLSDFTQIFTILLDNAIKYSKTKITIQLKERSVLISNDGAKIKPTVLPHIFERFYQADKSREGVGLGLSIAKSLADRNHWQLNAKSAKLTTFTLEF